MVRVNTLTPALLRPLAGILALVLLTSCGGGAKSDADGEEVDAPTESTSQAVDLNDYIEVPQGAELAAPGTELALKKTAQVIWQPRQAEVAVAEIRINRIQRTTFKDAFAGYQITDDMAAMTPYFVRGRVTNPLKANLSKMPVPLGAIDDNGTFVEKTVMLGNFSACPGNGVLPKNFKKGKKATLCWVFFLAQGRTLESVGLQMPGGLASVTWTGDVKRYQPPKSQDNGADDE